MNRSSAPRRLFLAGIMQGSLAKAAVHDQDYRRHLKELLAEHLPDVEVYDPRADHAESIGYDAATGREVFFHHNRMCGEIDVLLAFVPEASMGTAVEMWEAYRHGAAVITISPMAVNWAVRFLSHEIYPDLPTFEAALVSGEVARRIEQILADRKTANP
ncbi:MAG: hypothetical protein JW818_06600 [Pirellulales bacterium]|nr:hypothetical protein [Pirellulales bacterium]